jgi:arginase
VEIGLSDFLEGAGHTVRIKRIETPLRDAPEIAVLFDLQKRLAEEVSKSCSEWSFPLVVSGNCACALGVTAGLRASGPAPAVCWLDAHADFNTPDSTRSGFIDGMSLATLTGHAWKSLASSIPAFAPIPEWQIALIGARDLDPDEAVALEESRVMRVAPGESEFAFRSIAEEARRLYFHVDLDVLDPSVGKANSFSAPGGLTVNDVISVLESARGHCDLTAAAITSYDPIVDLDGRIARAALDIAQALTQ